MTTRRHHNSKSSGVPADLLKSPEVRSPQRKVYVSSFIGTSVSQPSLNMTKSLLDKFLKHQASTQPKHRAIKSVVSPKPAKPRLSIAKSPKSMSLTLKDPQFEIDGSKELSVIRSVRTPRTTASTFPQRGLFTESSSAKSTPQTQSTHINSECLHREQFESQVIQLEVKLTEHLKASNKNATLPGAFETQFPIYSEVFQEVIDRDRQFGSLLAKIRGFYEEWLKTFAKKEKNQASEKLYEQCTEQLKAAKLKLKMHSEDKKLMLRRIGNLSKETLELSQNLEELELENEDLKAKLDRIRNVDLNEIPMTEEVWKYIVEENHSSRREVRRLRKKVKLANAENETLQTLITRMRDRGFPIEELEEPMFPDIEDSQVEDFEPIVTGPGKAMDKPRMVPMLRLKEVAKENFETDRMSTTQQHQSQMHLSMEQQSFSQSMDVSGLEELRKMGLTKETVVLNDGGYEATAF